MKKKPASKSAFFNPRVLIGLAFCSIGLLLALLAFALYPGGTVLAQGPTAKSTECARTRAGISAGRGRRPLNSWYLHLGRTG